MYKQDLVLNNLQWLICHKTKPNHWRMLLMSLFLVLQQCSLCVASEMGAKWLYSCCFVAGAASRICSKWHTASLCYYYLAFSLVVKVQKA